QAGGGIRGRTVTGVQTCALPISLRLFALPRGSRRATPASAGADAADQRRARRAAGRGRSRQGDGWRVGVQRYGRGIVTRPSKSLWFKTCNLAADEPGEHAAEQRAGKKVLHAVAGDQRMRRREDLVVESFADGH